MKRCFFNRVHSTLGVATGSDLAPETVKAFTNHLGKWVRSEFKKSDGDTELLEVARTSSGQKKKKNTEKPYEVEWLSN